MNKDLPKWFLNFLTIYPFYVFTGIVTGAASMLLIGFVSSNNNTLRTALTNMDSIHPAVIDLLSWIIPAYFAMTIIDHFLHRVNISTRLILSLVCGLLWYLFFSFFGFR
jgi:uncharacterized membrane protein